MEACTGDPAKAVDNAKALEANLVALARRMTTSFEHFENKFYCVYQVCKAFYRVIIHENRPIMTLNRFNYAKPIPAQRRSKSLRAQMQEKKDVTLKKLGVTLISIQISL